MSVFQAIANQNTAVSRVTEGTTKDLQTTFDGSLFTANWRERLALEGRMFQAIVGALTTGITGGGTATIIDLDRPDLVIGIPTGTSIIPDRVEVNIHDGAITASANEVEALVAVDQDALQTDGTYTTVTIYNSNTLSNLASNCWARRSYSADMTDPVLDLELARLVKTGRYYGTPANAAYEQTRLEYHPRSPRIINGPAMLIIYFGGTVAVTGFIIAEWIEIETSKVKRT